MTTTTAPADVHPFTRSAGGAAWVCECGRSRNSKAHAGVPARRRATRPAPEPTPFGTVSAAHVEPGTRVVTSDEIGTDFGLPLVEPTRRQGGFVRTVRSHLRESGGTVVRFTDGTKTRPLHGQTAFVLAGHDGDGQ